MSWLTKVLGIDAKREAAQRQNDQAKAAADAAAKAAADQAAQTAAAQKQYNDSLIAMSTNAQKLTDTNNAGANAANISNVIAGGTASDAATLLKKKQATTLSSSLGINI